MSTSSDFEAYILGIVYGLLPPVKCHATGGSQIVEGKCEPDHFPEAQQRCMILAHWYDHTNITVKYNPFLNQFTAWNVKGTLGPDIDDHYEEYPEYNGKPTYRGMWSYYYIWWNGIKSWLISETPGDLSGPYWKRDWNSTDGEYEPFNGATGIATVSCA